MLMNEQKLNAAANQLIFLLFFTNGYPFNST